MSVLAENHAVLNRERPTPTPLFELDAVGKRFGYRYALRDVSLSVAQGEFLSVFGANGAGKTTLLNILSNLWRPTSGRVLFMGREIRSDPQTVRKRLGVISHETFLYDYLTAEENLRFYSNLYNLRLKRREILRVLERFGLTGVTDKLVRDFSHGMKQRLALARATIHNPEVLLLDEPFTGLDVNGISFLCDLCISFHSEGKTVILTTHEPSYVIGICSHFAILNSGKLILHAENNFTSRPSEFRELHLNLCRRKG